MALCASCGEDNPVRARFCLTCGTPFAAGQPAATVREVRKIVTVVFCDLTGSTELGERLDPEPLRALLDLYFTTVSVPVHRHGGTLEKFIGDAVVAVFGVPVLHEDDALRAVRAAVEMAEAVSGLSGELERRWGVSPEVRIGVNTGEVLAGDVAGRERLATGDAVNVAARLEQAAAPGQVVIGQETYRLVHRAVRTEALPPMALKGKAGPVTGHLVREVLADEPSGSIATPLVGRDAELGTLRRTFDAAVTAGASRGVLVRGPAGIGKSRLSAEFLAGLGGRATVLSGQCLPYGRGITFWPVREMLRVAAGWTQDESVGSATHRLATVLAGASDAELVAERAAALVGLGEEPGRLEEGFWAIRRVLETLSRWRPLVVVVEDLHWGEPALLDLVEDLLRVEGPVLVLCSARPELFDTRPGWGAELAIVDVHPLGAHHCDELIDALLGSHEVESAVRDHVRASAEGNPFFVEQLLATFREDGVLVRGPTGWVVTGRLSPDMIPRSIQTLLQARLERLTGEEQAEIEVAAVVGRLFWRSAVAELAREAVGAAAGSHLVRLVDRDLISPETTDLIGDDAYRFRHILVRDAAYAALPKAARADAHERFAEWLARAAGHRVDEYDEILGHHLERAFVLRSGLGATGDGERRLAAAAARRLLAAGTRSFARGDIAAAVNLLGRAHELLADDPHARLALVPTLAEAHTWRGDVQDAEALLRLSTAEAEALGDRRLVTHLALARASVLDAAVDQEQVGLDAVRIFTEEGDDEGLARAWMLIGSRRFADGRSADAEDAWSAALAPARRAAPVLAEETAMWLASYCMYGPTSTSEMTARLDRIEAEVAGKPYREGILLRGRAFVAATRADFPRSYRLLHRSRETFVELGLRLVAAVVSHTTYEVALREGTLAALVPELEADEQALAAAGERWARSSTAAMLAHALCAAGRLAEASEAASCARDLTSEGDVMSEVLWRTAAAKVASSSGRPDEAQQLSGEAVAMAAASDWLCLRADALLDHADVLARDHREVEALAAVGSAVSLYERKGDDASVARADSVRARLTSRPS